MTAFEQIAAIIDAAQPVTPPDAADARNGARPKANKTGGRRQPAAPIDPSPDQEGPTAEPSPLTVDSISSSLPAAGAPRPVNGEVDLSQTLEDCAQFDHSDTDNGKRLIAYFGGDMLVLAQSNVAGGDWLVWNHLPGETEQDGVKPAGKYWDLDSGAANASLKAQQVGDLIMREAEFMAYTPEEQRALDAASAARTDLKALRDQDAGLDEGDARVEELLKTIAGGERARKALASRKQARKKFGVSSKNKARIEAMLACAAPRLRQPPEAFNADHLKVATATHTLAFVRDYDPECPDPDVKRIKDVRVVAVPGHVREDRITALVPIAYQPAAKPKRWLAFIERFLPDPAVRRTVQQYTGLGLLGLPIQRFMFHHGEGANGKSVFLETIGRVIGPSLFIGLPTESIVGRGERGAGQASPDIARLFGRRMVRVAELPPGQPLQTEVVKKLTGGEAIPVRSLFKGFFEFQNVAKPHFSANGFPLIDDPSNGIWRRMFAVKWPVNLALSEQRDFEDVVGELVAEAPAILNWMIEGARDYLMNGFVVADAITTGNQEYRDDMDPTGPFVRDCVEVVAGETVKAREMYKAYVAWSLDAARKPITETKFGRLMKHKVKRDDTKQRHVYVDVRLHDVPAMPDDGKQKGRSDDDIAF